MLRWKVIRLLSNAEFNQSYSTPFASLGTERVLYT